MFNLKEILEPIALKYGFKRVGIIDRSLDMRDSITFFAYHEKEEEFADDEAQVEKIYVQVDIWSSEWNENLNDEVDATMRKYFKKEVESRDLYEEDVDIHHKALRYSIKVKRRG